MALYIPHSIFHSARLLYVMPETFEPYCVRHHLMYSLFFSDFNETFSQQLFEKIFKYCIS